MNIELRNVKYAAFASEETSCFEATIYIDGKKAGTVSNDGHGGSDNFHPWQLQKDIDAYAATLPPQAPRFEGDDGKQDAESIIGDLLSDFLEKRDLKRMCGRKTLFRKPGESYERGEYHTVKSKFTPDVKAFLVKKYGDAVEILNERI